MQNKELLVNRVCSGILRCPIFDRYNKKSLFILKPPTSEIKYEAEEVYQEALEEAEIDEMCTEQDIVKMLVERGLWNNDKELMLEGIPKQIDTLKVQLFELTFKSNERKTIRRQLELLRKEYEKLFVERHGYDQFTRHGYANLSKNYFIIANTLYYNEQKVNPITDDLLNNIFGYINTNRINENTFRELARTDPWRSMWSISKSEVFGCPSSCFTEEQKSICLWSRMYDNVYEHSDCPNESIINDDDMLDGWFIAQRRKREAQLAQKEGEELLGDRLKNADEVYLVVDSIEDARKVEALNNTMGKITKAQRSNVIQKQGEVKEADLPDRKQQQISGGNPHA